MTPEARACLESLDTILRSDDVREQIRPIVERVRVLFLFTLLRLKN
jgi:hypothetical protein